MTNLQPRAAALAVVASAAATSLWFVLAWRNPTSTYHFAPLIGVVVGPYVVKSRDGRQVQTAAIALVGLCGAIVAVAIAGLAAADRLRGPTFWSSDGAALEAILFAGVGAAIGFFVLARRNQTQPAPTEPQSIGRARST